MEASLFRDKKKIVPISRKDRRKTGHSYRHWISIGYYSGYQSVPSVRPVDIQKMIAATWGEGAVAFTAGIEAMFPRIRLREADARLH